jgi:hypothetical protein
MTARRYGRSGSRAGRAKKSRFSSAPRSPVPACLRVPPTLLPAGIADSGARTSGPRTAWWTCNSGSGTRHESRATWTTNVGGVYAFWSPIGQDLVPINAKFGRVVPARANSASSVCSTRLLRLRPSPSRAQVQKIELVLPRQDAVEDDEFMSYRHRQHPAQSVHEGHALSVRESLRDGPYPSPRWRKI